MYYYAAFDDGGVSGVPGRRMRNGVARRLIKNTLLSRRQHVCVWFLITFVIRRARAYCIQICTCVESLKSHRCAPRQRNPERKTFIMSRYPRRGDTHTQRCPRYIFKQLCFAFLCRRGASGLETQKKNFPPNNNTLLGVQT